MSYMVRPSPRSLILSVDKPFHKHALLHAECAVYVFWRTLVSGSQDEKHPKLALLVFKGPAATLSFTETQLPRKLSNFRMLVRGPSAHPS